jgi:hypothetical protein
MEASIIVIENEDDLNSARELVSQSMGSEDASDRARLRAQALILHEYESKRWPVEPATAVDIIQYIMGNTTSTVFVSTGPLNGCWRRPGGSSKISRISYPPKRRIRNPRHPRVSRGVPRSRTIGITTAARVSPAPCIFAVSLSGTGWSTSGSLGAIAPETGNRAVALILTRCTWTGQHQLRCAFPSATLMSPHCGLRRP